MRVYYKIENGELVFWLLRNKAFIKTRYSRHNKRFGNIKRCFNLSYLYACSIPLVKLNESLWNEYSEHIDLSETEIICWVKKKIREGDYVPKEIYW